MLNQKFEEFKASNMVTVTIFNIMINSIKKMKQSKASDLNTLDNLLQEMEALNITKNTDTYNNTINLLGQYKEINRIEKANDLYMLRINIERKDKSQQYQLKC